MTAIDLKRRPDASAEASAPYPVEEFGYETLPKRLFAHLVPQAQAQNFTA